MRIIEASKQSPPGWSRAVVSIGDERQLRSAERFVRTVARGHARIVFHGGTSAIELSDPSDVDRIMEFCGNQECM
jgi:hypothetical protein